MSPDAADLALLNYLEGEPEVVRAAEVLCDAAARLKTAQESLTDATAALTVALSNAGVREHDQAQIACAFVYLNHRSCHTSHATSPVEKGRSDEH